MRLQPTLAIKRLQKTATWSIYVCLKYKWISFFMPERHIKSYKINKKKKKHIRSCKINIKSYKSHKPLHSPAYPRFVAPNPQFNTKGACIQKRSSRTIPKHCPISPPWRSPLNTEWKRMTKYCWWKKSGVHQLRLAYKYSLSHSLQGILHIPGGWNRDFFHQQYHKISQNWGPDAFAQQKNTPRRFNDSIVL